MGARSLADMFLDKSSKSARLAWRLILKLSRSMPTRRAFALRQCGFVYVVATVGTSAQPLTINLDPSKTKIEFTLGDVLHTVHGTFKLIFGRLEINPGTRAISGQVIVDATSGESGNATRDGRMRKSILESDRFQKSPSPQLEWRATSHRLRLLP